jgi:hypothetical protein
MPRANVFLSAIATFASVEAAALATTIGIS